jgi:hypothetical protein
LRISLGSLLVLPLLARQVFPQKKNVKEIGNFFCKKKQQLLRVSLGSLLVLPWLAKTDVP